jgi:hypothetical protein
VLKILAEDVIAHWAFKSPVVLFQTGATAASLVPELNTFTKDSILYGKREMRDREKESNMRRKRNRGRERRKRKRDNEETKKRVIAIAGENQTLASLFTFPLLSLPTALLPCLWT